MNNDQQTMGIFASIGYILNSITTATVSLVDAINPATQAVANLTSAAELHTQVVKVKAQQDVNLALKELTDASEATSTKKK